MVRQSRFDLIVPAWLAAIAALLIGATGSASVTIAQLPKPAFAEPEQLHYSISWAGIPVGESTLISRGMIDEAGGHVYHFASTATSNHVLRLLYPVRTRIDSIVDAERFLPIRYTMEGRQGFQTRSRELQFDQTNHVVQLTTEGQSLNYPTVEAVQDPLSALYYYRLVATMQPGEVVRIPVHDRKRPKEIVVTAGPVESVTTEAGTFQASRLKIKQEEEGVFLHQGDITVWMTADERRLPVRMEGHVTIGTVEAELEAYTGAPSPHAPQEP